MHLLLPIAKGHLSNVATISWQIGWPYSRGTAVLKYSTGKYIIATEHALKYMYLLICILCYPTLRPSQYTTT